MSAVPSRRPRWGRILRPVLLVPGGASVPRAQDGLSCGRQGRVLLLPVLFCLASVAGSSAQPARTQGWVLGLDSGAAAVSFGNGPGDGATLVGLRVGYGLNRVVAPYLGGAYADIRSRGLEAFDRVTFSHVDLGARLHWAGGRRRWVPYADLALTFWRVSDVVEHGEETAADFTSRPTFSAGGGVAIQLWESWALDVNVKAARGTFRNVPAGDAPAGGASGQPDTLLHPGAASARLAVGVSWWP